MSTIPDRKTATPRQLPATDLLLADSRATGSSHKETGKLISHSERTVGGVPLIRSLRTRFVAAARNSRRKALSH